MGKHRSAALLGSLVLAACAAQPPPGCPPTRTHVAEYAGHDVREKLYYRVELDAAEARAARALIDEAEASTPAAFECWYRAEDGRLRFERHSEGGGRIYLFSRQGGGWRLERGLDPAE